MTTPHLSVVMVTWHPGPEFTLCLRSLAAARRRVTAGLAVDLVVVDNASHSFPTAAIEEHWPDARVLRNPVNRGFGPAANQGARQACAPVVLFLNPDTLAQDDPFTPLVEGFEAHPEAVALAPRLADDDDVQNGAQASFQLRHLPGWGQAFRELLLVDQLFPRNRFRVRDRYLDRDRTAPFPVEQPAAAALAVRGPVFGQCGGFDEQFSPAWFEDVDLCARLAGFGALIYWPASTFRHQGGVSAERLGYDRFLPMYYTNAVRYWTKHRGRASAAAYRVLVAAGMALRLAALPCRRRLPRSRREAAGAYLGVLTRMCRTGSTDRGRALSPPEKEIIP